MENLWPRSQEKKNLSIETDLQITQISELPNISNNYNIVINNNDKYVNNGYSGLKIWEISRQRWKLFPFFFKENFKTEKHDILCLLFKIITKD